MNITLSFTKSQSRSKEAFQAAIQTGNTKAQRRFYNARAPRAQSMMNMQTTEEFWYPCIGNNIILNSDCPIENRYTTPEAAKKAAERMKEICLKDLEECQN